MTVPPPASSPFLQVPRSDWVASNELAFALRAGSPVRRGHTLVVPRRCVATYFAASAAEKAALWVLVDEVKLALDEQLHPDGYNVGFDTGEAAGQTVLHLHIHVIPRFSGDARTRAAALVRRRPQLPTRRGRAHAGRRSRWEASTIRSARTCGRCSRPPRRSPSSLRS
ncbi:MAG: HIT family protein [Deltaproteobacteria bacterium]